MNKELPVIDNPSASEQPPGFWVMLKKRLRNEAKTEKDFEKLEGIEIDKPLLPDFVVEEIERHKNRYDSASNEGLLRINSHGYRKVKNEDGTETYIVSGTISKNINEPQHGFSGYSGDEPWKLKIFTKNGRILEAKEEKGQYESAF